MKARRNGRKDPDFNSDPRRSREVTNVNSIVIYASHFGNTKRIAEAIAGGLQSRGAAQLLSADEAPATFPVGTDLVVIGGPTEVHRMTQPLVQFFDRIGSDALRGIASAGFDTRLRWPRWLSGSAGAYITQKLRHAGARVIVPAESFFIKGTASTAGDKSPELDSGELERAAAWGVSLAVSLAERAASAQAVG